MKKQDYINIHAIGLKHDVPKVKHKYMGFEQPLPDIIGFKQHRAECGSDCIQEVLLFSDEIREYTQPIFYNMTKEQIDLRTRMYLDYDDWHRIQEYFHFVQKRFSIHYDAINYLRSHNISAQEYYDEFEKVCLLNPLFKNKERVSLEAGVIALKRFKEENVYTATGLTQKEIIKIIDSLLNSLSIPFHHENSANLDAVGILVFVDKYSIMGDGVLKRRSIGHYVGFMKVLSQWVYYDNNLGFIKVDETIVKTLKAGHLRIVFDKKTYFTQVKDDKIESVWTDKGWKKYNGKDFKQKGVFMYYPKADGKISILKSKTEPLLNEFHKSCDLKAADLHPKTVKGLKATMDKFRKCIYSTVNSNSKIFENMYKFLYESIELVKAEPDTLEFIQNSVQTVVTRPACSPMTLYWCSLIYRELNDTKANSFSWFTVPELRLYNAQTPRNTPTELLDQLKLAEEKRKKDETPKLTPCLPGQIRDAKTRKCRDRKEKTPKNEEAEDEKKEKKTRKSRCPKGQFRDPKTGLCVDRLEPCPPGEIRDKATKKCRPRDKKPCPPDQIRDPVTKECRDKKTFKF